MDFGSSLDWLQFGPLPVTAIVGNFPKIGQWNTADLINTKGKAMKSSVPLNSGPYSRGGHRNYLWVLKFIYSEKAAKFDL